MHLEGDTVPCISTYFSYDNVKYFKMTFHILPDDLNFVIYVCLTLSLPPCKTIFIWIGFKSSILTFGQIEVDVLYLHA